MDHGPTWEALRASSLEVATDFPELGPALRETVIEVSPVRGLSKLLGRVLQPTWMPIEKLNQVAEGVFISSPDDAAAALDDLRAINGRNLEVGDAGAAWTWIGNRGLHILIAHRIVHRLWVSDRRPLALAMKAAMSGLGVDIHPAARFGRRIFLDHGVGLVVGETAVVEDDVSIWHGVTLGSTLMEGGDRHPKVRRGAIVGAGATILGNIEIGEGAIVASGSVVLHAVPSFTVVAGNPALPKPGYRHPFDFQTNCPGTPP